MRICTAHALSRASTPHSSSGETQHLKYTINHRPSPLTLTLTLILTVTLTLTLALALTLTLTLILTISCPAD